LKHYKYLMDPLDKLIELEESKFKLALFLTLAWMRMDQAVQLVMSKVLSIGMDLVKQLVIMLVKQLVVQQVG